MALSQLPQFMAAIRQIESGGRYTAIGPSTRYGNATGAYQFLDSTWDGYGGFRRAADAPPSVQDARAAQLMTDYYQRFGSWDLVAVAWHAGPGNAQAVADGRKSPSQFLDAAAGTNTGQYVSKLRGLMGSTTGGIAPGLVPGLRPGLREELIAAGMLDPQQTGSFGGTAAPLTREQLAQRVREQFPAYAWLLNDPEVGNLLLDAVDPNTGFDEETMRAKLMATNWWREHSEAMRRWDTLVQTDPAEAEQELFHAKTRVQIRAARLGVRLTDAKLTEIATMSLRMGWPPDLAELHTDRILTATIDAQSRTGGGEIGSAEDRVKALMARYMIPASNAKVAKLAEQVVMGDQSWEGIVATLADQARALYPNLRERIDAGDTPADIFEPYQQIAAQTLERTPESISYTDPKWLKALQAGQDGSPMSLGDWQAMIRTDRTYGWHKTKSARDEAFNLAHGVLVGMGALRR